MSRTMTPALLDTRRRLLGLSIDDTADLIGVNPTTINRYMNGKTAIHDGVQSKLDGLEQGMRRSVKEIMSLAKQLNLKSMTLTRYRTQQALDVSPHAAGIPLGAHAMLIGWAAEALEAQGIDVLIEFAE